MSTPDHDNFASRWREQGDSPLRHIGIPWTATERWFARLKEKVTWRNPLRYLAKIQNVWSYRAVPALPCAICRSILSTSRTNLNLLSFIDKQPGQNSYSHMHNEHLGMRLLRPFYRRALAWESIP
jgi:spore coat protein SA